MGAFLIALLLGVMLSFIVQVTVVAFFVFTQRPKEKIIEKVEQIRRKVQGRAEIISASSPEQERIDAILQSRTMQTDL